MNNAFEVWRELRDIYLKYIDTGLPMKDKKLEDERKKLLLEPNAICKNPIIELIPRYEEYCTLSEACSKLGIDRRFAEFSKLGLFTDRKEKESKIYKHQFDSLKEAIINRKHIIATTGTGSGKTECFLLPLICDILLEKVNNNRIDSPAVRGLILYPLNALAEDQMKRLRKSLSSKEVINWLDKNAYKKRITFGRYTGITPISGKENAKNKAVLKREEEALKKDWESAKSQSERLRDSDYLYDIPNMDVGVNAELWDRWTMQKTPPDILITNYSMLNIMLMRTKEDGIFEKTKSWLKSDSNNIFHLVVDELHSYRGTSGTEVAYLIRLLLMRLGLSPDSPQVQFLSSSASMQETDRTRKFVSGFFGLEENKYDTAFKIIKDSAKNEDEKTYKFLSIEDYNKICNDTPIEKISQQFEKDNVLEVLRYYIPRAKESELIAKEIFGEESDNSLYALEGLLVGLSKLTNKTNIDSIQPIRAHYFFRNIEGLWACTNENCTEVHDEFKFSGRKIGKLYRRPQVSCKCGSVILELLLCRHCGELYFGGWETKDEDNQVYLSVEKESINKQQNFITIYPKDEDEKKPWRKCNFNNLDGRLRRTSNGSKMIFEPPQDYVVKEPGYPYHCYNCEYSQTLRGSNTLTPIFKQYTGVQKINQLMADALIQGMNKYSDFEKKNAKLVLFSDSRQAAAKLAAGIELDHYRDTIRALVLNSLEVKTEEKDLLRKVWLNKKLPTNDALTTEENLKISKMHSSNEYKAIIGLISWGDQNDPEIENFFESRNSIRLDQLETKVVNKLFESGINPGGPGPSINIDWINNYDFNSTTFDLISEDSLAQNLHKNILFLARKEILITIFAHNKRSLESLIQGKVISSINHPNSEMNQFINSAIRIMGESWRIEGSSLNNCSSFPRRLRKYAKRVCDLDGSKLSTKMDELLEFLIVNKIIINRESKLINGRNLTFLPARVGDKFWKCHVCGTIHLHESSHVCVGCHSQLESPSTLIHEDIENLQNYYIYLAHLNKGKKEFRLHCEELTGQTNKEDGRKRQRLFQNRFLENEIAKVETIDLLSVTTTMEAGVDIGSLSAVMMGNVPPQRFNYQQRVGRAGRRGKFLSVALTIAKGNSHDQTHYAQSHRMVSDIPPDPYLELSREEIFNRVLNKEILKQAFLKIDLSGDDDRTDNVHGEFGRYYKWPEYRPVVKKWIQENTIKIIEIATQIKKGTYISKNSTDIQVDIVKNLLNNIDIIANDNKKYTQIALSERLANAGYLPMFGFPTQVRVLYEKKPDRLPAQNVVDRNLDLAISEFAPGSEIIKDKKVLKAVGVVHYSPYQNSTIEEDGRGIIEKGIYRCKNCETIFVDKCEKDECTICKSKLENFNACSPLGFCVEYGLIPTDFDGRFEWASRAGEVTLDPNSELKNSIKIKNLILMSNRVPTDGIVHKINDNSGKLFLLGRYPERGNNKWVVKEELINKNIKLVNEAKYAFISSKHTGVITLSLNTYSDKYHLDANNPFHKAIFYSWAFLIRKAICDHLDIEINEFDVGYRVSPISKGPEIYIVEKADNGAGYCNYLNGINEIGIKGKEKIASDVFISSILKNGRIYNDVLMKGEHQKCSSSCYDCLRDYYNQQYHSLLNWRVALDLASLAENGEAKLEFQQEYWKPYIENILLPTLENKLNGKVIFIDHHILIKAGHKQFLITHPFWHKQYIKTIKEKLSDENDIIELNIIDAITKSRF